MAPLSPIMNALVRKAMLVGAAFLVIIGLVELSLWGFAPMPRYLTYRFDFKNAMAPYGLADSSVFEVDSRELRHLGPSGDHNRRLRILILGGEGTYQPLQDAEDTWWGRLAVTLEKAVPEVGIEVDVKASPAGAWPGAGTSMQQGLQWARTYAAELDPDVLVLCFGLSEVLDVAPDYRYDSTTMEELPPLLRPRKLKSKVVAFSQIARRLRQWRSARDSTMNERRAVVEQQNYFLNTMGYQRRVYEKLPFDAKPPRRQGGQDPMLEYLDGLRSFHALAKQLGAELVVMGEPSLHDKMPGFLARERLKRPRWLRRPAEEDRLGSGLRPDPAWVQSELNRYYAAARAWAEKRVIPFVNLNRDVVLAKDVENFVDDTMLTQLGSQRVTAELSPLFFSLVKKFLAK